MLYNVGRPVRVGRLARALMLGVLAAVLSGCQTVQYYKQAISGQYQILSQRQPIMDLLADPDLNPELKQQFERVLELRAFAERELHLPIDNHYLTYVGLDRRFVVWNVHAAPEFSLEPKTWWYPLVGSLKYRGYFGENDARAYARQIALDGHDVHVEGVEAYSTLGWFADPILSTFIHHPEPVLAEIIFHELTHQRLFLSGDTDFNEAFATAVAEEGVRRWLLAKGAQEAYQRYLLEQQRVRQFVALIMNTRTRLQELYGEAPHGRRFSPRSRHSAPEWMREEKALILARLREQFYELRSGWGDAAGYDAWFARPLNNAQLNTIAVYYELVPGFEQLLQREGHELERFYRAVRDLGHLSKSERRQVLLGLATSPGADQ